MSANTQPLIELFVQASNADIEEKGPCLTSQQWFMVFYSLVERGLIDLRLTPVTLDNPPKSYLDLNAARHLPVAWIESGNVMGYDRPDNAITSWDDLELLMELLGYRYLNPRLDTSHVYQAEEVFEDLISHLMQYIRCGKEKPYLNSLEKIDRFLASKGERFLLDSEITYPDCLLMPKLQHARVLCRAAQKPDIPGHLRSLCRYIGEMYRSQAFMRSCPSDRDIILHYMDKNVLKPDLRLRLLNSTFLSDIPGSSHVSGTLTNGSL